MTSANRPSPATKPTVAHNERDDGHVACVDVRFEAVLVGALTVALSDRTGLPAGARLLENDWLTGLVGSHPGIGRRCVRSNR